jgi:cytochrome c oxidase cbb3-type subunit 4
MDLNDLRSAYTLLALVLFVGIVLWAFSSKRKARFEQAARLPFTEEQLPEREASRPREGN